MHVRRLPFMAGAGLALVVGLAGGLLRLGWGPATASPVLPAHGPLMVCGFLGTLIGLERAVSLGKPWAYAVPLAAITGSVLSVVPATGLLGRVAFLLASLGLVGVYGALLRLHAEAFLQVMGLGAAAWAVGNGLWLGGAAVADVVPWWLGFLVLTIAGERLELSRMLAHPPRVQRRFLALVGLLLAALALTTVAWRAGEALLGLALVLLAVWLLRWDVARQTIRAAGLTRYVAVCLLTGYAWLVAGGVLLLAADLVPTPYRYDAYLHAVFVGFVFSMIFGHAPLIVPAVLGVRSFYRAALYVPLALLHASLLLRVVGDLLVEPALRRGGGLLHAVALGLFVAVALRAKRQPA